MPGADRQRQDDEAVPRHPRACQPTGTAARRRPLAVPIVNCTITLLGVTPDGRPQLRIHGPRVRRYTAAARYQQH